MALLAFLLSLLQTTAFVYSLTDAWPVSWA